MSLALQEQARLPIVPVSGRGIYTGRGLVIDGTIQCYDWERSAQSRYARAVAKGARHIVNVGYGLGYAQSMFEGLSGMEIVLIEHNPWIIRRARHRSRSSSTRFVLGTWEDHLADCTSNQSTVFFDGFPVERNFDYSAQSFSRYLGPFMRKVSEMEWRRCYFIAFDDAPLSLPRIRGFRSRRLAKAPLPVNSRRSGVTNISLYELKRVIPSQGGGE